MSVRGRREPLLQRGQELIEPYVSLQSLPALTRLHEIESLFDLGLFVGTTIGSTRREPVNGWRWKMNSNRTKSRIFAAYGSL
jgi:hypothetical protein